MTYIDYERRSSDTGAWVAKPEGRQTLLEVNDQHYQVPVLPFEHFTTGPNYFIDKRVFPIRSREELDLIRYTTAVTDIIIQQDLSNGFWKVLQPSNVDLEMRYAFFMVNTIVNIGFDFRGSSFSS